VRACDDEGCPGETRDCAGRVHMLWKIAVVSEHARVVVFGRSGRGQKEVAARLEQGCLYLMVGA
jgi:hypothetical protein